MLRQGVMWGVAALCLAALPLRAQPTPGPAAGAPAPAVAGAAAESPHALTAEDAQAWLDGAVPYALARGNVAGAVVVIVKDGQTLLQKGYGWADIATHTPVDPATTLFRPGSVSKLFTWTAVMQQVEQGKIDLDRDVNSYLDFSIPPFDGKPVTMRNLMTHTAGFQETNKDLIYAVPAPEPALDAYLKQNLPERIFPAGLIPSYSNYGAALAGYIVQRVSGQSFDDYIERQIFAPLGMSDSTFRQPLPKQLEPLMAHGYEQATDAAKPFEIVGPAPAGSSSLSASDMAHFMIAHLQDGQYGEQRILQAKTAQMMHSTALNNIPPLNSMLLGFYQMNRNGHRIIGHAGDTQWFHSELSLFLDDHVGLFVSMNSLGKDGAAGAIRRALREQFTDRYFPAAAQQSQPAPPTAQADAAMIAGTYITSRREETTFFSLLYYLLETTQVAAEAGGGIMAGDQKTLAMEPIHFVPVSHFVWRDGGGKMRLAATTDADGRLLWTNDESPYEVYSRVPWFKDASWMNPALSLALAAFLLTALLWPVTALYRRRYGAVFSLGGSAGWAYRLTRIASLCDALLMIVWPLTLVLMLKSFALNGEMDGLLMALHWLSVILLPLAALILLWNTWLVWTTRTGIRSWFARIWSIVLAVSGVLAVWAGVVFHLIGFGLKY